MSVSWRLSLWGTTVAVLVMEAVSSAALTTVEAGAADTFTAEAFYAVNALFRRVQANRGRRSKRLQ